MNVYGRSRVRRTGGARGRPARCWRLIAPLLLLPLLAADCDGCGSAQVPAVDASPPSVSLFGFVKLHDGSTKNVEVDSADGPVTVDVPRGSTSIQLTSFASDADSGVLAVEIWVGTTASECEGDICSITQSLVGHPAFTTVRDAKAVGEAACVTTSSSGDIALDLPDSIPIGSSIGRTWRVHALATNYTDASAQTATVTFSFALDGR